MEMSMLFRRSSKRKITIGDHKQIEQLLRHLGMIAKQVDQGIAMVDPNRTMCFVNMPWAKMHGYKTSYELLGKQISSFYNQEQVKTVLNPLFEETKRRGRSTCTVEHVRADGATFPTQMKMIVSRNKKGKAIGFIVITTDITERKQLEETATEATKQAKELRVANEQLKHQITEHEQAEECLKQQIAESTAANAQLKDQINEYVQAEECLKQQIAESTAANAQLKDQIVESEKARKELMGQLDALKDTVEEIQYETTECSQGQEILTASTDNTEDSGMPITLSRDEKLKAIAELAKRLR
jgi:PAS domain S-box-containing protein